MCGLGYYERCLLPHVVVNCVGYVWDLDVRCIWLLREWRTYSHVLPFSEIEECPRASVRDCGKELRQAMRVQRTWQIKRRIFLRMPCVCSWDVFYSIVIDWVTTLSFNIFLVPEGSRPGFHYYDVSLLYMRLKCISWCKSIFILV